MSRLSPVAKRNIAGAAVGIGLLLVVLGINASVTGRDAQNLPPQIQSINPVRSAAQVQMQEKIQVDLIDGYTGVLVVDNIELPVVSLDALPAARPGQQVDLPLSVIFEPGNNTLSFQPTKGALIEKYNTGVNTVVVRYWKIVDGPAAARSFTWQFDVI
ncbi:MAG: hypothetical protein F2789_11985 [Actinobacteria bacterium]|nr:hypothetical protein [Actinomycetota bacterium]